MIHNQEFSKPMLFDPGQRSYWKQLRAIVVVLVLSTVTATAETYHLAPAPSGSDANDCSSPSKACATFQRAANLCPRGAHCGISVAPGVYSQKTNVAYYRVVSVSGPQDENGHCIDRSAVVVDDRINGLGQAGAIFSVQDHAILTISCMTLAAYATGSVGFASRQFAIGDVNYVDFRQFRGGHGIVANETSKVNIHSPGVYGDAARFASAGDLSQLTIGGTIRIGDGLTFDVAFLSAFSNSVVLVYPSTIVGGEAMSGASYQCSDAIIKKNVILPGGDVSYVGNENCRVFGLAPDKVIVDDRLSLIYSDLAKLNPELKLMRAQIEEKLNPELSAIRSELDEKLNPEIKAIRTEIDTNLKTIYELLRNCIIAVLAVLALAAIGASTFYVWQWHRRRRVHQPEKFSGL
jgi:hypothetical protein